MIRKDAERIIKASLASCMPDEAVRRALSSFEMPEGKLVLVSIGKAGWQMASAASKILGEKIDDGIVVTKYGHSMGALPHMEIIEAGHPVPDRNSFLGAEKAIGKVRDLGAEDAVIFLISGGGSALFEKPLVSGEELEDITKQLLASGAGIVEMNTIRKRLSGVKGGRFAEIASPARVFSVVLSDVIGDPLDMIASGPAHPDSSTSADALRIADKYGLRLSDGAKALLSKETPKTLSNVETMITGSVRELCEAARKEAGRLGYETTVLTDSLTCEAREAGSFLASIAAYNDGARKPLCFIAGGETVVHLTGHGKGGRNQELALSAARGISGMKDTCIFSLGSDGTDGPTDAAGGYVDGTTEERLSECGISIDRVLSENDAYTALASSDGLIMTGPTGTNVNDVAVLLIRR